MLGVVVHDKDDPADQLLRELGEELGVGDTYRKTPIGVYLDNPGKTVPDPFFEGEGPERTGCMQCGRCMVGCPHGAKNTLVKNYLWLAEHRGVEVQAERTVTDIRPLGAADGSDGYAVSQRALRPAARPQAAHADRARRRSSPPGRSAPTSCCSAAASAARCRASRRASASWSAPTARASSGSRVPEDYPDDLTRRVAITSSIYPDPHTHIETVTYGEAGDSMSLLNTLLVGDGTRVTRPLKLLGQILRHPLNFAKIMWPKGSSRRTIILLVMQTLDNAIALRPKLKRNGEVRLQTEQDPERPNPTFIPVANEAAEWLAKRTGGIAESSVTEAAFNIPTTAHILGGAVIGHGPEDGVVDSRQRVFGYENLMVCDGAAVPANVGVNPSLTITALAEHAMSQVPPEGGGRAARPAGGGAAGSHRLARATRRSARRRSPS